MSRYPDGLVDYVRANYMKKDPVELAAGIKKKFGIDMNPKAVRAMKKRYKLSGGARTKVYSSTFPKEVCDYIKSHYVGTGPTEMTEKVNRKFGKEYSRQQVLSFYKNNHLNSGLTGHFVKGQVSHNKGQKLTPEQYEKAKATMFKKANRPHNALPVGSEVVRDDGYHQTKIAEPNKWMLTHILIWQQAHGPVPEGYHVSFKDGNRDNLNLSNLFLETLQEHLEMNRRGYRSEIPEITEAGLNIAKLRIAIRQKSDNGKKNKEDKPMAKKTKEKPIKFTSEKFKEIKRKMDKTDLEDYVNGIYFQGFEKGKAAAGFDVDEILSVIGTVKGIGPAKKEEIRKALMSRKE